MSQRKPALKAPKTVTVVPDDPDVCKGRLKNIGGSQSDHWNNTLAHQTLQALRVNSNQEERDKQFSAAIPGLL
jgi:hypothetical protein